MCLQVCMYAVKELMSPIRLSSATFVYGSHAPGWHEPSDSKLVLMQIVAVFQYYLMKQMVSSRLYASADLPWASSVVTKFFL